MIRFRRIIYLLSVVLAIDSEDKFEQCALVNELVDKGKVRWATSLFFNLVKISHGNSQQTEVAIYMCNVGEFKAFCPDSCDTMTSNLPNRGGTFIGNEYRANIKMGNEVPASEFVATNIINDDKGKEGDRASRGKIEGYRI